MSEHQDSLELHPDFQPEPDFYDEEGSDAEGAPEPAEGDDVENEDNSPA